MGVSVVHRLYSSLGALHDHYRSVSMSQCPRSMFCMSQCIPFPMSGHPSCDALPWPAAHRVHGAGLHVVGGVATGSRIGSADTSYVTASAQVPNRDIALRIYILYSL